MIIEELIPQQGFEIVRDAIGAILFENIQYQASVRADLKQKTPNLFVSRSHQFNQAESVMHNVQLDSANYTASNERSESGATVFFIDTFTSEAAKGEDDGGYLSSVLCDRYTGIIRWVLQHHKHKTLGLPNGTIMGTQVDGFENFLPSNEQDSAFVKASRITFSVRINESQSVWQGVNINSIFTNVKLDLTDKGYQFQNNVNN